MGSSRLMTASASKWITFLSLLALTGLPAGAAAAKLTNEDVVRMWASDLPEPEILKAIAQAEQIEFDLSADVVTEMRLVGVPDGVIRAMQERAARTAGPGPATEEAEGVLELSFEQKYPPGAKKQPGLPLPRVGFFLYCVEPTHAPDYWTTKTPLAQKFPRHHLLWFHEPPLLAGQKQSRPKPLPLPAPARVTVAAGIHKVQTGVAVWAPDQTWRPLALASRSLDVAAGGTMKVVVSVTVHKLSAKEPITVAFVEPPPEPAPSAGTPPGP